MNYKAVGLPLESWKKKKGGQERHGGKIIHGRIEIICGNAKGAEMTQQRSG